VYIFNLILRDVFNQMIDIRYKGFQFILHFSFFSVK